MSRERAKGTAAETAVVRYLREEGFPHAERRALSGSGDRGDIAGVIGCVHEIKNCKRDELPAWVDELRAEMRNDGAHVGGVWHKRRGRTNPADWFVTTDGATHVHMLRLILGIEWSRAA